jgi:hypothetical protein
VTAPLTQQAEEDDAPLPKDGIPILLRQGPARCEGVRGGACKLRAFVHAAASTEPHEGCMHTRMQRDAQHAKRVCPVPAGASSPSSTRAICHNEPAVWSTLGAGWLSLSDTRESAASVAGSAPTHSSPAGCSTMTSGRGCSLAGLVARGMGEVR